MRTLFSIGLPQLGNKKLIAVETRLNSRFRCKSLIQLQTLVFCRVDRALKFLKQLSEHKKCEMTTHSFLCFSEISRLQRFQKRNDIIRSFIVNLAVVAQNLVMNHSYKRQLKCELKLLQITPKVTLTNVIRMISVIRFYLERDNLLLVYNQIFLLILRRVCHRLQ